MQQRPRGRRGVDHRQSIGSMLCGLQQRDCFGDRADFWTAAGRTMSSHPLQTICGYQKARYDAYAAHR